MKMKCIECGTDNTFRDRTKNQGFCKKCSHQFAFEPDLMAGFKLTDSFFEKTIEYISNKNLLFFTSKQLFSYLKKRLIKRIIFSNPISDFVSKAFFNLAIGLFIGLIPSSIIASIFSYNVILFYDLWISSPIIFTTIIFLKPEAERSFGSIEQQQFQDFLNRWEKVNGPIDKLLHFPTVGDTTTTINADISAYSFDRALICDRAETAQFLIANNFHFENNCAVLSVTGYPQSIFETIMQMLHRNSELKVFALHDASPTGFSLVHILRSDRIWFPDSSIQIFDLGLLPRQVFKNKRIFSQASEASAQLAQQLPEAIRQNLMQEELQWLDRGRFIEIEYFTSAQLMRAVNLGITKNHPGRSESLFSLDEGDYVTYSDSFG